MERQSELSAEDQRRIREIAEATNRRNRLVREKRAAEIATQRKAAWAEVRRLLDRFHEIDPGVDRLIVFGSLARDDMKRPDFDIDVAVRSERYLELLGPVLESDFAVDLVDLANASSYITDAISREGVEIRHGE